MSNLFQTLVISLLAMSCPALAHEFWLWPTPFDPAAGSPVSMEMKVGEQFSGERIAITAGHVSALRVHANGTQRKPALRLPADASLPSIAMSFPQPGAYLIAFDSEPSLLTLPADKFHAYLHDEGLDAIVAQRERAGTAARPGRERFRRHAKTLLRVGGATDATYAAQIGQRLEIIPRSDPQAGHAGERFTFRVVFDDKPLSGALVKAWHKHDEQTLQIRARTDAKGDAHFSLPYAGPWMISVVHMIAIEGNADLDWDSFWGNLTFELAPAQRNVSR